MKRVRLVAGGVAALVCLVVVIWPKGDDSELVASDPPTEVVVVEEAKEPVDGMREDISPQFLKGYGSDSTTPAEDLALVSEVIGTFVYTIKVPDALPTGSNRELVVALLGGKPYRIRFIDPEFPFLNTEGEIVDRWDSPLFFHFVEASEVGVRSAGPDQVMWTADDVVDGEYSGAVSP